CDPDYRTDCPEEEWWRRFDAASGPVQQENDEAGSAPGAGPVAHQAGTGVAVLCELLSSGAPVLAICADAGRRAVLASAHGGVARFGPGPVAICSFRDGEERFGDALEAGFGLLDYRSLLIHGTAERPGTYVCLIDPPAA